MNRQENMGVVPTEIVLDEDTYQQLYDVAKWYHDTPECLDLVDQMHERIDDFFHGHLRDVLPDGLDLFTLLFEEDVLCASVAFDEDDIDAKPLLIPLRAATYRDVMELQGTDT